MLRDYLRKYTFHLWYLGTPPWESGVSPPELMDFIEKHPPGQVIDLGCGTGTNVITLAQHGWQATGIDFASNAIRRAKQKADQAGVVVDLRVGEITKLENLGEGYDLVLDMGCYHSLSPRRRLEYRNNLTKILSPGGTLLLYAFTTEDENPTRGVSDKDIQEISRILHLQTREDGEAITQAPSAWFWFIRKPNP
jgi:cyclopropane fatty-acyl-phospholipid synthase-like methyltransferase